MDIRTDIYELFYIRWHKEHIKTVDAVALCTLILYP